MKNKMQYKNLMRPKNFSRV